LLPEMNFNSLKCQALTCVGSAQFVAASSDQGDEANQARVADNGINSFGPVNGSCIFHIILLFQAQSDVANHSRFPAFTPFQREHFRIVTRNRYRQDPGSGGRPKSEVRGPISALEFRIFD